MKSAPPSPEAVSALEEVRQQFQLWRKTKTGRERIPDSLWQAAAEVFYIGGHSLHKISKTLHLNYTAFKQHVESHLPSLIDVEPDATPEDSPAFIAFELDPPSPVSECIIEMEDSTGAKMRMCLRGKTDPSILGICKSFWRHQP
ncbi:hypothetical protein [Desulfobacula toluolica]|uniref:hypothetical protein n=1 Tax=Desulfobacula toluolica TaxID=28223 RepID=UPI00031D2AD1|nr:hypothetical protein [Desulfobacula toluolica]